MRGLSACWRRLWLRVNDEQYADLKVLADQLSMPGEKRKTVTGILREAVDEYVCDMREHGVFDRRKQDVPVVLERRRKDRGTERASPQ